MRRALTCWRSKARDGAENKRALREKAHAGPESKRFQADVAAGETADKVALEHVMNEVPRGSPRALGSDGRAAAPCWGTDLPKRAVALIVDLAFHGPGSTMLSGGDPEMAIDHVEGPLPSSTPLERDARLVSTDHKVAPIEIAIGVIIGRAAEYFDFFVFAIASVVVFPKVFFPFAEPLTATLYSFAMFSLAFVARPIGSVIFTAVDRPHGRGVKLTLSLFFLGFSTMAISFLPGDAQIGAWSLY